MILYKNQANGNMKNVAVIGAGCSGLTAIKCCLDEGLEPVCFERTNYISGLWHYTDEVEEGQACVMKTTVINTSKEMMAFSDFPIPEEYPIFMHHNCVDQYFHLYADKFGLMKYIQFNTEVLSVKQDDNFDDNGKWKIQTKNSENTEQQHVFDAVLICTGHHADKNIPHFKGLDKFKGKVTHTRDYKDYHPYEDKRVLIIGIGNSGGDVATDLSRISSQVYLSTRSGTWILNLIADKGIPFDMLLSTRYNADLMKLMPGIQTRLATKKVNQHFDHEKYCLRPKHSLYAAHPTVNDELPNRIISGGVIVKANVAEFTETGAIFEDGTEIDNLDAVVLATGYIFGFPFLDQKVLQVKENQVNLYKYMFPPELHNYTLAVIGCFQPLGALMPITELQCRLATRVFKGLINLPKRSDMWQDITYKRNAMAKRYTQSIRHTMQVDWIPFMDELAELVGCKPKLWKLLLTDPRLAYEVYFGPCTPYQYRLFGPGQWSGARKAIVTQWGRLYKPLQTRPYIEGPKDRLGSTMYVLITLILAVLLYFTL